MKKIGEGRYQEVFLEKELVLKIPRRDISKEEVTRMKKYYDDIKGVGIKVPKYHGRLSVEGRTAFKWDYCGIPLVDVLCQDNKNLGLLGQVFNYGLLAYKQGVAFFPILEQFTVLGNDVYFIDFLPSRTREDFNSYEQNKREDLGLMFFGLGQKIIRPAREALQHPQNFRNLQDFILSFLDGRSLGRFKIGLVSAISREITPNNPKGYSFVGEDEHFQESPFYDGRFDFVIQYPNRNIWTRELFINDREVLEE